MGARHLSVPKRPDLAKPAPGSAAENSAALPASTHRGTRPKAGLGGSVCGRKCHARKANTADTARTPPRADGRGRKPTPTTKGKPTPTGRGTKADPGRAKKQTPHEGEEVGAVLKGADTDNVPKWTNEGEEVGAVLKGADTDNVPKWY